MRKLSTRSVLLALLVIVSLSSYIYLNTVSVDAPTSNPSSNTEQPASLDDLDQEDGQLVLPDVRLLKKVMETGKRFIPAT